VLGFVSLRGEVGGKPDEPQHELMGGITTGFLDLMGIKWEFLSSESDEAALAQLVRANDVIESGETFFFVVKTGTFSKQPLKAQAPRGLPPGECRLSVSLQRTFPSRFEALQTISSLAADDTVFLATTGFTGREMYEVDDKPNNFYMVGSMGCVSSLGLGLALARPDLKIVVIDGDGSLLMRMGGSAVLAAYHPANIVHVLLDNNAHDSTGGQKTVSDKIDFPAFAESVGYDRVADVGDLAQLRSSVAEGLSERQLTFVYMQIAPGAKKDLGRPKVKPPEVRQRFMSFVAGSGVASRA
jgi:phosphonopyruvate decarboxylase